MLKVVIAPDSFKDALSAFDVTNAIATGMRQTALPVEICPLPMGDGGEGFASLFTFYHAGQEVNLKVQDPLRRSAEGRYVLSSDKKIACIEMAQASGLEMLAPSERNCMHTTTYGTGELIRHALDQGVEEIILGLGGSATCDAGVGMAQALGYQFLGEEGNCLHPVGKDLSQIAQIDATQVHPRLHHVSISIACDVENPLYGPQGAAFIFAPQKGANQQEVRILDQGLQDIAHLLNRLAGKSVENILGAGAAGGMGAGAMAFLRGELQSGAALVGKWAGLSKQLADADLIITGEGKLDSQSKDGKLISYIMKEAHQANVPVIALCGSLNLDIKGIEELGLISAQSILTGPATLDQALKSTKKGLELAAYSAFRLYYLGRSM